MSYIYHTRNSALLNSPAMNCKPMDAYILTNVGFFTSKDNLHVYIFIFSNVMQLCARLLWTQNWSVSIFPFREWNLGQMEAIFCLSEGLGSTFGVCLSTTPQSQMWGAKAFPWWMVGVWWLRSLTRCFSPGQPTHPRHFPSLASAPSVEGQPMSQFPEDFIVLGRPSYARLP